MTKPVTRAMAVNCLLWMFNFHWQVKVTCPECGDPVEPGQSIQFDHLHAVVFDGPHEYQNLRPTHTDCHKEKTARDIKANSKIKRIRRETRNGPKRKIPSRGFDKNRTRHLDGTVTARGRRCTW